MNKREFEKMNTKEIVRIANEENDQIAFNYLIKKYEGLVYGVIKSQGFYLQNGDDEDLFQEGLQGLFNAIKDYKEEFNSSFESFCQLVVKRAIITAVSRSNKKKNKPLNETISFDKQYQENENLTLLDILSSKEEIINRYASNFVDPQELFIIQETLMNQREALDKILSPKEKAVNELFVEKMSYSEIAKELNLEKEKDVDNTIQRIKRKMRGVKFFEEDSGNVGKIKNKL